MIWCAGMKAVVRCVGRRRGLCNTKSGSTDPLTTECGLNVVNVEGSMILRLRARCMRDRVGVEVWMEVGVNAVCVARGCRGQIMPDTFVAVVRVVEEQLV